jgi:exo-beta-1,3-glucanase (GH17 family)
MLMLNSRFPSPAPRRLCLVALLAVVVSGARLAATEETPASQRATGPTQTAVSPVRPVVFEFNGQWIGNAVCFSPYRRGQSPGKVLPSDEEIYQDLRLVQRYWSLLRLYDSSAVAERTLKLIREHQLPLHVLLGCWVDSESQPANKALNEQEAARTVRLASEYRDIVLALNVGNETQVTWSGYRSDPEVLIRYIRRVRGAVSQPVSTADDYSYWKTAESKRVAAELDFLMVNLYALWNGQPLEKALEWTARIGEEIRTMHAGKPIVISETGWATRHDVTKTGAGQEASLMKAEVSVAAQEEYLRQHYAWVMKNRVPTFLFEAFDESWKGGGAATSPDAAEKHWGVFDEDRRPKPSFAKIAETYYR